MNLMKNNWQKKIEEIFEKIKINSKLAPVISGGAAIWLMQKIVSSNLDEFKFALSLLSVMILFISSTILYFTLGKFEKEKDVYLLSVIGRTVGDVFKKYGQKMADKNADHAKAEDMNKIMQTIVNLVKEMHDLGDKKYRE